jgi:two-component system sensor histidine kinase AtoS
MLVASMACLLASRIQTEATQSLIQKAQRFIVIGQVTTGLLHELRNKLSIAGRASSNLLLDCDDFSSQSRPLSPTMLVTKMRRRAERIADASDHLTDLLNEHLGLTRQEKAERVDVNEVLLKTVQQVTPFAEEQDVEISFHPTPHLPPTLVVGVHLAQVFLNIALNAIQQMGIQRVRYDAVPVHKRGALRSFLKITTALDSSDTECPLKIRFMDDGPGIHRKHWTWVFELGTTTRAGGTGLGLYVCRNLIKAIGGRITVERSFMFVGTTFLIELPGLS